MWAQPQQQQQSAGGRSELIVSAHRNEVSVSAIQMLTAAVEARAPATVLSHAIDVGRGPDFGKCGFSTMRGALEFARRVGRADERGLARQPRREAPSRVSFSRRETRVGRVVTQQTVTICQKPSWPVAHTRDANTESHIQRPSQFCGW